MPKITIGILLVFLFSFSAKDEPCVKSRLFQNAPFYVGTALNTEKLKYEEAYWTTALGQFNSFTPEKVMKPHFLHPVKGKFNFTEIDHLIGFCREKNIRLHGHTLIWHKSLPSWMENFKGDRQSWESMFKEHIQTIVEHCRHYVKSWDVVNEAFNDDGTLRDNIWLRNLGESYIEKAFLYASEADPAATLFYNDYGLEEYGPKLAAVLKYLDEVKRKGIRIDGIGMQMHVSLDHPAISSINRSARAIQQKGYQVHYSELDITLAAGQPFFISRKKLFRLQKNRMKEIVEGYMTLETESRFGITMWGVGDNDSWLTDDRIRSRPLLFDNRYRAKPAYCGFLEALEGSR